MFPSLRPVLNKGGAGRYISRGESVSRLLPVSDRHLDLLQAYDQALATMPQGPGRTQIEAMMPYLRTEVAKISETILSLGGTPDTGVTREPLAPRADASEGDLVQHLLKAETDFEGALRDEVDAVHHQERTRAILNHNADASVARRDLLRGVVAGLGR